MPFDVIEAIPADLFHAIWLEIGGRAPAKLDPLKVQFMLNSRAGASSQISDGAGQIHCSFDIDQNGFSRGILFHDGISAARMGRLVLRVIEMETYRMLALLGLPVAREHLSTLVEIERALTGLTRRLTEQISGDGAEVQALLPALSQLAAQVEDISANTSTGCQRKTSPTFFWPGLKGCAGPDGRASGLHGFLDRRMMPASRTVLPLMTGADLVSAYCPGRIITADPNRTTIQRQNRDLLSPMDNRLATTATDN